MALAQDIMALGTGPALAARTASGGTGPVSIAAAGSTAATATQIYGQQFVTCITSGTGSVILPSPTGANGPLIADIFTIHNSTGPILTVFAPAGVTINVGGAAYAGANPISVTTLKTLVIYTAPTTTQWFGLSA
jgi:hypothetical protein